MGKPLLGVAFYFVGYRWLIYNGLYCNNTFLQIYLSGNENDFNIDL